MATQLATTEDRQLPALTVEGERFALRQRQARMFAMSPLVPEHLRKGTADQAIANCWIALTLAEAMGEVPLIVMQNIHVVNGKAGFAAQYMIARANSSGIFKGRIDWRITGKGADLSVTAYAVIKDSGQEVSVTCDMAMAKAEGWTKNAKYTTMPEVMLRYRSAAFLVRFYAPDVMLGYQTSEEIEDVVAAAVPSAEPLTSKMLIDQSQPDLAATPARDEDDVAVTEDGEIIEPDAPAKQPETILDALDEPQAEEPHPATTRADAIIDEIRAAIAVMDVNSIESRERANIDAMPAGIAKGVRDIIAARKAEIKAERETKQPETAE